MEYNAVLNRVRPMLTNGNHLSAQGFEAFSAGARTSAGRAGGDWHPSGYQRRYTQQQKGRFFLPQRLYLQAALVHDQRAALRIGTTG